MAEKFYVAGNWGCHTDEEDVECVSFVVTSKAVTIVYPAGPLCYGPFSLEQAKAKILELAQDARSKGYDPVAVFGEGQVLYGKRTKHPPR